VTPGPVFEFSGVTGGYGSSVVVRGLGAAVAPGEVLAVLGRNGVGKSTLLKLLHGFLPLRDGEIRHRGVDIRALTPAERSRRGISFAPQERIAFDNLSVRENLWLMHPGRRLDELEPYFRRFPRLRERLGQRAGTLSGGERKLLSFVRAFAEDASLVLLDEPSEGVQRENVEHMIALIRARQAAGTAFVLVEQNLAFAEAVASRYVVLDQGRVVLAGERDAVTRDAIVAHLGV
jgi:branched-chain amino acid transport system ATP-binding protein